MKNRCQAEPCDLLGPYPATSVAALADLGLTDQEIARYFRVQPERITRLRFSTPLKFKTARKDTEGMTPVPTWT